MNGRKHYRNALTLTELVVVIAVIVILMAVTVPLVQPVAKGRDTREGGRQLHVFLAAAQARAIELGRPVGVWFERELLTATTDVKCTRVYLAEVPPPYAGDTTISRAQIDPSTSTANFILDDGVSFSRGGADLVAAPHVAVGDFIRFDNRGPTYRIQSYVDRTSVVFDRLHELDKNQLFRPPVSASSTYQIFRRPRKKQAAPLILPNAVSVQLQFSGVGVAGAQFGDSTFVNGTEIVLMFNPNGTVEYLYPNGVNPTVATTRVRPQGTIYLLVGHTEQTGKMNCKIPTAYGFPWAPFGNRFDRS